ncbi:MAG TPA: hypothetical protein DDW73_02110 [Rhizobium sp.]|jgi:hypothetical protein|nr:hypothetical protein [Rhizobium sp.]
MGQYYLGQMQFKRSISVGGTFLRYRMLVAEPGTKPDSWEIERLEETLGQNGVTPNYCYETVPKDMDAVSKHERRPRSVYPAVRADQTRRSAAKGHVSLRRSLVPQVTCSPILGSRSWNFPGLKLMSAGLPIGPILRQRPRSMPRTSRAARDLLWTGRNQPSRFNCALTTQLPNLSLMVLVMERQPELFSKHALA